MTDAALKKSLLSCPGDTIQEHIDHIGISQKELAERLGRSVPKLNELIKGKAPLTKETASGLEYVLDIPAGFWLNLERQYQEELLEIEQLEQLEEYKDWAADFPLAFMKENGILPNIRDLGEIAGHILRFFKVASPKEWKNIYKESSLAFKIELKYTKDPEAISTWLRLGELQAEDINLAAFDKKKLTDSLPQIKEIAYQYKENWLEELQDVCASFGVALVYTPCIPKAPIYGASRWIKNKSIPLIQMTDRRKDYHAFWFSFYHELAHIRYHNKSDIFIEGIEEIKPDELKEKEADDFASRMILNAKEKDELSKYFRFDEDLILELSKKLRKHPGFLVAQLQRDSIVSYRNVSINKLKPKVRFNELELSI